jgi:hypothetical protein
MDEAELLARSGQPDNASGWPPSTRSPTAAGYLRASYAEPLQKAIQDLPPGRVRRSGPKSYWNTRVNLQAVQLLAGVSDTLVNTAHRPLDGACV